MRNPTHGCRLTPQSVQVVCPLENLTHEVGSNAKLGGLKCLLPSPTRPEADWSPWGMPFAGSTREFLIKSGYATAIFNGDVVGLGDVANSTDDGYLVREAVASRSIRLVCSWDVLLQSRTLVS